MPSGQEFNYIDGGKEKKLVGMSFSVWNSFIVCKKLFLEIIICLFDMELYCQLAWTTNSPHLCYHEMD